MTGLDWSSLPRVREWAGVDKEKFDAEILPLGQPALLRGLASDWPIVAKAQASHEALSDYIAGFGRETPVEAFYGEPGIKGCFSYSEDLRGFNFERRRLALGELLSTLLKHLHAEEPPSVYAGAIPLTEGLAGILDENRNPLIEPSTRQLASIWIGNRSRASAHWDLPQNIACVVSGRRRFTLFPITQLRNLYIGPLELTVAGQPTSLVDFHDPDYEKFPRFREAVQAAEVAELAPGDALYLPSLWIHHVESLDALGVLINYWWREAQPYMYTPRQTMLHALLSIRDMPARERLAWREVFDHYIFQLNGDPMEHLPDEARGLYGNITPERLKQIRLALLRSLGVEIRE